MRKPVFGFFRQENRETINTLNLFRLKLCYANNIDAVAFNLSDVDFENKTINASYWTKDGLKQEITQIPHLIEYGPATEYRSFFRENATIIDDFNLSKEDVNNLLLKTELANMVIPTICTTTAHNALKFSLMCSETILKPLANSQGRGILCVKPTPDGGYTFTDSTQEIGTFNLQESVDFLTEQYGNSRILVQPRMSFRNKDGQTMDFRVTVSKNGNGEWELIFILPRTARNSIVSNVSSGGYASELEPLLGIEYAENADKVRRELHHIAKTLPPIIEKASGCYMLSLGIDVGIDFETLNPYIIEVNYVPQVHFKGNLQYYYTQSDYIAYLVKKLNLT